MKNNITCNNCNSENPFYGLTCQSCKSYLRERVVNVDLFEILGLLIENPLQAFKLIIYSEHKNFIYLILFLSAGKLFINSMFVSLLTLDNPSFSNFLLNYIIILLITAALIFSFSFLINFLNKFLGLITRIKDNFSILIYSLIPSAFGLIFLFPVELILFGGYLFSNDPSPFLLKETVAYFLLGFEVLIILWSLLLTVIAMVAQSKNLTYSMLCGIIFHLILFYFIYLCSIYLY